MKHTPTLQSRDPACWHRKVVLQTVRHHKSETSEDHAEETKATARPPPSLPSHDLSVQFTVPLKKFKTFATNCNDPPYYSPILHLWLASLVWQRGRTAELEVHWVWRTFWNRNFHPGTCLHGSDYDILPDFSSTCCGHHNPTTVVNHVLQCGNSRLSGNKAISMLMTPRMPKEINSQFFISFAKNAFLIENYHHIFLNILNISANFFPVLCVYTFFIRILFPSPAQCSKTATWSESWETN